MNWHTKLSTALAELGYTPELLAVLFGFHVNTAKNYLDGTTQPRFDVLYALCRLAGVSADWVLDDDRPIDVDYAKENPRGIARPSYFEVITSEHAPTGSRSRVVAIRSLGPELPITITSPSSVRNFARDLPKRTTVPTDEAAGTAGDYWEELPGSRRDETEHDLTLIRHAKRSDERADGERDKPLAEASGATPPAKGGAPKKRAGRKSTGR